MTLCRAAIDNLDFCAASKYASRHTSDGTGPPSFDSNIVRIHSPMSLPRDNSMRVKDFVHRTIKAFSTSFLSPGFEDSDHPGAKKVKITFHVPNAKVMDLFVNEARVDLSRFGWKDEDEKRTVTIKLPPGDNYLEVEGYGPPGQPVTIAITEPIKWEPPYTWKCRKSDGWIDQGHEFTIA